jgi:hypothetical protein
MRLRGTNISALQLNDSLVSRDLLMPNVISSTAGLLVNQTFALAVLLRGLGIGFALVLSACQKQEAEQSGEKKSPLANTAPDDGKRQFEADVEKSKQNAVARFPDLGVAGSEMNKAFVARVKHLQSLNSPEFNHPTWPYQLACKVDDEMKLKPRNTDISYTQKFTVAELLSKKTVPFEEIILRGIITKAETGVGNKLGGVIVIDRKIRCDFEWSATIARDSLITIQTRGDFMLATLRDPKTSRVLSEETVFRVGQYVELRGRVRKKSDGSLTFKFAPPDIGTGSTVAPAYR